MSEELHQKLRTQLWTVANTLRGNMSASDQQGLKFAIWQQPVAQISEFPSFGNLEFAEMFISQ